MKLKQNSFETDLKLFCLSQNETLRRNSHLLTYLLSLLITGVRGD